MAQAHLDRLSAIDAAFLHQEDDRTHMHIGACAVFEGPAPELRDLLDHVESRLDGVPRYRQALVAPLGPLGRFRWADDPAFNLEYHVRHTALPAPGDGDRLRRMVARVFSQQLDRTKPLWELWLVEGLEDDRFALVSKTHHALVDGVAGVDLMTTLFDPSPQPPERRGRGSAWAPRPRPSAAQLAAIAARDAVERLTELPLRMAGAAARPAQAVADARTAAEALAEVAWTGLSAAPDSPLNVRIGSHRRVACASAPLADLKAVKQTFGGTVNDVVLAVVAGALRRWLHARGRRVESLQLKACVPVSVRATAEHGALGNRLTQVVCPLPVYEADAVARLRAVSAAMADVKDSKQALGAELIAGMQDFAPPTILAQASRLNFASRFFNLLVTNIPGPQFPLYVLGRRMQAIWPVAFLAGDRALAVAAMSYDGGVHFGLIGDYDAMDDLEVVARGIGESVTELVGAAVAARDRHGSAAGRERPRRARRARAGAQGT